MNPHEDLEAEALAALTAFEEAIALHEMCVALEAECLVEFRHMRSIGWGQARGTVPEKKDKVEYISAKAEGEHRKAEEATRRAMEVIRMRREQFGMVRSKMANQREEKGSVMRDGMYRGA